MPYLIDYPFCIDMLQFSGTKLFVARSNVLDSNLCFIVAIASISILGLCEAQYKISTASAIDGNQTVELAYESGRAVNTL